jgi:fucose permease
MNLLHFFYGVGSTLSPRAAGALASTQGWRMIYLLSIPAVLLFFILSIFARFPRPEEKERQEEQQAPENQAVKRTGFLTALKTPMVWLFSIALGLMVAVELCSPNWAGLYFQDVYHLDPKTSGASFVSNFYILFTVSRLLGGFVIEKVGYLRSLFITAIATILILIIGFALGERGIFILPGLGLFTAIFWPTILATAMGYFKEDAPVMTSAIIVIAGSIYSGIQFLIGLAGPIWGYRSCLIYAVLIVVSLIVLSRYMRNPYRR